MQEPEYSVPRPFVRHFDATVCKLFPDDDKKSFKVLDVAANEHQGSMIYQENRDRRKMPTKSREYITGT